MEACDKEGAELGELAASTKAIILGENEDNGVKEKDSLDVNVGADGGQ